MAHAHASHSHSTSNKARLRVVLVMTAVYLVAEVVGAILTDSLALLADAGHMLTDVGGIALALLAMSFAERPATSEKTYGYYRVEILAALSNAVVLVLISGYVLYEAYERFRDPPPVQSVPMMLVAAVGLIVNVAGVLVLRRGSDESLNMKGAYFEVLSDLLTSVGVLVAGLIMLTTDWYLADPILSAGIGLFILPRTWILMKEAVGVLLEGTPADVNVAALREAMEQLPGVAGVHDLHVWSLTSGVNAMSAHVVLAPEALYDQTLRVVHDGVKANFKIAHLTVQVEPQGWEGHETHLGTDACALSSRAPSGADHQGEG